MHALVNLYKTKINVAKHHVCVINVCQLKWKERVLNYESEEITESNNAAWQPNK